MPPPQPTAATAPEATEASTAAARRLAGTSNARLRDGGIREELAAGIKLKDFAARSSRGSPSQNAFPHRIWKIETKSRVIR
jgi:hypothetical protein